MRDVGALPDDPLLHAAVLAYAWDYSLLEPVLRRHGLAWSDPPPAPGQPRPRDVVPPPRSRRRVGPLHPVVALRVRVAAGSPSGACSHRTARLVASAAQEGMIRVKES